MITRSQSGSWAHCCIGAGLQQNIGKQWSLKVWKQVTNSSRNQVLIDTAKHSAKKLTLDKKRKVRDDVKAKRHRSKYARTDNDSTAARRAYSRHDGGMLPDECDDDVFLNS